MCGAPYPDCNRGTDTATMTVERIVVDNPGSGYATAPNVVVRDGTVFDPINPPTNFVAATGAATLKVLSVALDTFGAGYTSAPAVTFADTGAAGHWRSCRRRDRLRRGHRPPSPDPGLRLHHARRHQEVRRHACPA